MKHDFRRAELHDAPRVDDGDAIGERERLLAIVRHVHRGDADPLLQRAQLVPQLEPHL
jgi:hypothetical protein